MSAKSYKLNNGVSMPAIGERDPKSIYMSYSFFKPAAYGGWGGNTDKERDQFAPTFGLALKVGASSSLRVVGEFSLVRYIGGV